MMKVPAWTAAGLWLLLSSPARAACVQAEYDAAAGCRPALQKEGFWPRPGDPRMPEFNAQLQECKQNFSKFVRECVALAKEARKALEEARTLPEWEAASARIENLHERSQEMAYVEFNLITNTAQASFELPLPTPEEVESHQERVAKLPPPAKPEEKTPPDEESRRRLIAQKEEALKEKANPDPRDFAAVGDEYLKAGRPKDAARVLDRSVELDGKNSDALASRGAARLAMGDSEGALADARRSVALDPANEPAKKLVLLLEPRTSGVKVPARGPDFSAPNEALAHSPGMGADGRASRPRDSSLPTASGKTGAAYQGPAGALLRRASTKLSFKDYTGALFAASQAVDADPKNARAWTLRAEASLGLKNWKGAVQDASEALRLDPADPRALRARAFALLESGDPRGALADIEAALALEPGSGLGHLYRAMIRERLGDPAGAATDYRRAAALDSSLEPLAEEGLARLGLAPDKTPARDPARPLLRGGSLALGVGLVALGLLGALTGRRIWKTITGGVRREEEGGEKRAGDPAATLPPGTVLSGNFRIIKELGRGGMGKVYEAFDSDLQRGVAIKQLHGGTLDGGQREAFLKEARLAAKLRHPNLVTIHAVLHDGGQFYLVFDLVEGESLDRLAAARGRLPLGEVRCVLAGVGAAVDFAHSQRIIHRDLKPSNVMVGAGGAAKVMDFGIAHHSSGAGTTMTAASGTPPYMAPEQVMGSVSKAADIYAVGVMAYELLAGRRPFAGPDFLEQKLACRFDPLLGPRRVFRRPLMT